MCYNVRVQITSGGYRTKHGQATVRNSLGNSHTLNKFLPEFLTDCLTMFCPITSTCYLQSNNLLFHPFQTMVIKYRSLAFQSSPRLKACFVLLSISFRMNTIMRQSPKLFSEKPLQISDGGLKRRERIQYHWISKQSKSKT